MFNQSQKRNPYANHDYFRVKLTIKIQGNFLALIFLQLPVNVKMKFSTLYYKYCVTYIDIRQMKRTKWTQVVNKTVTFLGTRNNLWRHHE